MFSYIRKTALPFAAFFLIFILSGCWLGQNKIQITAVKTTAAIAENLMPVKVTDVFPKGTTKIFCWFQWNNAQLNTKIIARWYYATDNIHLLDDTFSIPRKEGSGSILLSMPEGKTLPSGLYRVDLILEKRRLKSSSFKIE